MTPRHGSGVKLFPLISRDGAFCPRDDSPCGCLARSKIPERDQRGPSAARVVPGSPMIECSSRFPWHVPRRDYTDPDPDAIEPATSPKDSSGSNRPSCCCSYCSGWCSPPSCISIQIRTLPGVGQGRAGIRANQWPKFRPCKDPVDLCQTIRGLTANTACEFISGGGHAHSEKRTSFLCCCLNQNKRTSTSPSSIYISEYISIKFSNAID